MGDRITPTRKNLKQFAIIQTDGNIVELQNVVKAKERRKLLSDDRNVQIVFLDPGNGRKIVPFFGVLSPFSNFFPSTFLVAHWTFCCGEQFYQYAKALVFDHPSTGNQILQTENAKEMKQIGRRMAGFDPIRWEPISFLVMVIALFRKFGQNSALRAILLATDGAQLVEASRFDSKWGCGKGQRRIVAGEKWHGQNILGRTLAAVRDHFLLSPSDSSSGQCPRNGGGSSAESQSASFPDSPINVLATGPEMEVAQKLLLQFGYINI